MLSHEQIIEILNTVRPSAITELTGLTRQAIYNLKRNFKPSYDTVVKFSNAFEQSWTMYQWVKENNHYMSDLQPVASDMFNTWYLFGGFNRKPSTHASMQSCFPDEQSIQYIDSLWVEVGA
jgi:hypothetical protein